MSSRNKFLLDFKNMLFVIFQSKFRLIRLLNLIEKKNSFAKKQAICQYINIKRCENGFGLKIQKLFLPKLVNHFYLKKWPLLSTFQNNFYLLKRFLNRFMRSSSAWETWNFDIVFRFEGKMYLLTVNSCRKHFEIVREIFWQISKWPDECKNGPQSIKRKWMCPIHQFF